MMCFRDHVIQKNTGSAIRTRLYLHRFRFDAVIHFSSNTINVVQIIFEQPRWNIRYHKMWDMLVNFMIERYYKAW